MSLKRNAVDFNGLPLLFHEKGPTLQIVTIENSSLILWTQQPDKENYKGTVLRHLKEKK